jgi:hypothetical protein
MLLLTPLQAQELGYTATGLTSDALANRALHLAAARGNAAADSGYAGTFMKQRAALQEH